MPVVKHAWSIFPNVELEKVRSANHLFNHRMMGAVTRLNLVLNIAHNLLDIETQRVCML